MYFKKSIPELLLVCNSNLVMERKYIWYSPSNDNMSIIDVEAKAMAYKIQYIERSYICK